MVIYRGNIVLDLSIMDYHVHEPLRFVDGYGCLRGRRGSLSHLRLDDLLGLSMVAACERAGVGLDRVDDIAAGCVNTAHEGMGTWHGGPRRRRDSPRAFLPSP